MGNRLSHFKSDYVMQDEYETNVNLFITVKNIYNDTQYVDNIESIKDNMVITSINCTRCNLKKIPDNMNFPQLIELNCCDNQITQFPDLSKSPNITTINLSVNALSILPEIFILENLTELNLTRNLLTSLPDVFKLPKLEILRISHNNIMSLPESMELPSLRLFNCCNNRLSTFPENMVTIMPNLREFYCFHNRLNKLPDNMYLPVLQKFDCSKNYLTSLPVSIISCMNLIDIYINNNPLELSPQVARFINYIRQGSINKLNVYNDNQNVHNSNIQQCVKNSIERLMTRPNIPKYNVDHLNTMILTDDVLTEHTKRLLIEYCSDNTIHSLLLLTFSEVLWYVFNTIIKDFPITQQCEIKNTLNQEILDAECKCFTGRINRIVNCLNGFCPLVQINVLDSEQIGNIIVLERQKLEQHESYTVARHIANVKMELTSRGYSTETIDKWIAYIE